MGVVNTLAVTVSAVLILHAAFSLQHYRSLMQDILEDATANPDVASIPMDIWIELGLGYVLLMISELSRGSMQPVISKGERPKAIFAPPFVTRDFDLYTTRAKGLGSQF